MMIDRVGLRVPKKAVKEEFVQAQLFVEDQYLLKEIPQEQEKQEEVERGVAVIDLF